MWRYSFLLQYDPWTHFLNLWDKGQFQHFEVTGSPTGDGVFCEERSNDPVFCHSTLDTDALSYSAPSWKFLESLNRHLCLFIYPQRGDFRNASLGSCVCAYTHSVIFGMPHSVPVSVHMPTAWRFSERLTRFLCLCICPQRGDFRNASLGSCVCVYAHSVEIFGMPHSVPVSVHIPTAWRFS
jgi:hypothetical protein